MREEEGRGGREYRGMESKTTCGGENERVKMERDTDGEKWITVQRERERKEGRGKGRADEDG